MTLLEWYEAREKHVRWLADSQESYPDSYHAAQALDKWERENPRPKEKT